MLFFPQLAGSKAVWSVQWEVSEGITLQREAEGDSAGSEISCRRTADGKAHQLAPVKLKLSAVPAELLPRSQPPSERERTDPSCCTTGPVSRFTGTEKAGSSSGLAIPAVCFSISQLTVPAL